MKLYHICTEATGGMKDRAEDIMLGLFPGGFTIMYTAGVWRAQRESSMVIEYVGDDRDRETVLRAANAIRAVNAQQSVCVQILECELVQVTE